MRVENWKRAITVFIRCYFLGAVLSNANTFSHKWKAIVTKILCQNKVQNFFLLNQDRRRKDGEKVTDKCTSKGSRMIAKFPVDAAGEPFLPKHKKHPLCFKETNSYSGRFAQ